MPNDPSSERPLWSPGAVEDALLDMVRQMREYKFQLTDQAFYSRLAKEAEESAICELGDILAHIHTTSAEGTVERLKRVEYLFAGAPISLWCVTEQVESPIEARLAAHLTYHGTDGYNYLSYVDAWGAHSDPDFGTDWTTQHEIAGMRPDFLFKACCKGRRRFLAVECDGHEFHERTKEQAKRDRSRDRRLLVGGIPVLRFTGSEIFNDVGQCVTEISLALSGLQEEMMAETGVLEERRHGNLVGLAGGDVTPRKP